MLLFVDQNSGILFVASESESGVIDLNANDLVLTTFIDAGVLGQQHGLLSDGLASLTTISVPAIQEFSTLFADSISLDTFVGTATLEQIHNFFGFPLELDVVFSLPLAKQRGGEEIIPKSAVFNRRVRLNTTGSQTISFDMGGQRAITVGAPTGEVEISASVAKTVKVKTTLHENGTLRIGG